MNIEATLAKCRAALEMQQDIPEYTRSWHGKARLKEAEKRINRAYSGMVSDDEPEIIGDELQSAAALLGVEVV